MDDRLREAERDYAQTGTPESKARVNHERQRLGILYDADGFRFDHMIDKNVAILLGERGGEVYSTVDRMADGGPVRARINGKCVTWKTRPDEWRLPLRVGWRGTDQMWNYNAVEWRTKAPFVVEPHGNCRTFKNDRYEVLVSWQTVVVALDREKNEIYYGPKHACSVSTKQHVRKFCPRSDNTATEVYIDQHEIDWFLAEIRDDPRVVRK